MSAARRARLVALHRWAGLAAGWLLFAIFLWGTLSVYDTELTAWMEPEIRSASADPVEGAALAERLLRERASSAAHWSVELPGPRDGRVALSWSGRRGATPAGTLAADAHSGRIARATLGGDLFYALHYGLMLGTPGAIVVGLSGLALLVLVGSGTVLQLPRLLLDLVRLRLDRSLRQTLRDTHVLTSVATLPFLAVFAWSGVVVFAFETIPATIWSRYGQNGIGYFADLSATASVAAGTAAPPAQAARPFLIDAVRTADHAFGGPFAGWVDVAFPADPVLRTITVTERDGTVLSLRRETAVIDGRTGALLRIGPVGTGAADRAARLIYGIHFARWGGGTTRALYALSGAIGTASIAAALALFGQTRRRRVPKAASPALTDRVSLAATVGLLNACLAPLWVNRLVPPFLSGREVAEDISLPIVWSLCLCLTLAIHRHPARPLLVMGAGLGLLLPALDVLTAPVRAEPLLHLAVDGTGVAVGAMMAAWLALGSGRRDGRRLADVAEAGG